MDAEIRSIIATTLVTSVLSMGLLSAAIADIVPAASTNATSTAATTLSSADLRWRIEHRGSSPADTQTESAAVVPDEGSADEIGSADSQTISVTIPPRTAEPACPADISGTPGTAPASAVVAGDGAITGTTSDDLAQFAARFNEIRVENCLAPVPVENFRYDQCMENRLIWMAEDPSTEPSSAWGHEGSVRSDGVPSVGCDGNLAGGSGNDGAIVAEKWWDSLAHRATLYRPDTATDVDDVCISFAMTHGGVPNEPASFTRAAARWITC